MEEQGRFLEILGEIKNIAALQQNTLSKEEIDRYLGGMGLDKDKMEAVYSYLASGGIKITGFLPDKDTRQQETGMPYISGDTKLNGIIKRFLMGEEALRDKIAEGKLGHVRKLASGYKKREAVVNQSITIDEIVSEGNIGLLTGISVIGENKAQYIKENGEPDYEAVHGIINMEIVNAMESFIDMEISGRDWENTMLTKANLLHEAAKYLTEKNGSRPSKEELSEYTKISVEEINGIMNLSKDTERVAAF